MSGADMGVTCTERYSGTILFHENEDDDKHVSKEDAYLDSLLQHPRYLEARRVWEFSDHRS